MTKKQTVFYSIAFCLILVGAIVVEEKPLAAMTMIAVSGLCVWIAERI